MTDETPTPEPAEDTEAHMRFREPAEDVEGHSTRHIKAQEESTDDVEAHGRRRGPAEKKFEPTEKKF
jgi:hypothetical protein